MSVKLGDITVLTVRTEIVPMWRAHFAVIAKMDMWRKMTFVLVRKMVTKL